MSVLLLEDEEVQLEIVTAILRGVDIDVESFNNVPDFVMELMVDSLPEENQPARHRFKAAFINLRLLKDDGYSEQRFQGSWAARIAAYLRPDLKLICTSSEDIPTYLNGIFKKHFPKRNFSDTTKIEELVEWLNSPEQTNIKLLNNPDNF